MTHQFKVHWQLALQADNDFQQACFQLYENLHSAQFYHHPDWLFASGRHLVPNGLNIALVCDNENHPLMLLPFCNDGDTKHFRLLRHDHLSLNDILIHKRLNNDDITDALSTALTHANPEWACFSGLDIPQSSQLTDIVALNTRQWQVRPGRDSARFDCSGTLPIPGKLRRNLTRLRKQLASKTTIETRLCTTPDELPSAFDSFLALEKGSWKGRGDSTAIVDNDALTDFYRQLLTPSFAGLKPIISLLLADDRPVAAQYGLMNHRTLSLLKVAYDESYAHYSPGSLLLLDLMNHCIEQDIDTLSLVTAPKWAERWHPLTSSAQHLNHYNQNLAGAGNRLLDKTRQSLKQSLRTTRFVK